MTRHVAVAHFGYWWRSRFSRLIPGKCKLSASVVFDFATSIEFGDFGSVELFLLNLKQLLEQGHHLVIFA